MQIILIFKRYVYICKRNFFRNQLHICFNLQCTINGNYPCIIRNKITSLDTHGFSTLLFRGSEKKTFSKEK